LNSIKGDKEGENSVVCLDTGVYEPQQDLKRAFQNHSMGHMWKHARVQHHCCRDRSLQHRRGNKHI